MRLGSSKGKKGNTGRGKTIGVRAKAKSVPVSRNVVRRYTPESEIRMAVSRRYNNNGDHISLSAVEQRVFTTEQGLSSLATGMEARMNSMAESINRRIDRLSEAVETRSAPQYQTMFAGMGVLLTVLGMVGTIVYVLIQSQLNAGAERTAVVAQSVQSVAELVRTDYVPRNEAKIIDTDNADRATRISDAVIELRKNSITLSDHQALIDRLARVEVVVGSTYPLGDVLKDIQARLSVIERGSLMRSVAPSNTIGP